MAELGDPYGMLVPDFISRTQNSMSCFLCEWLILGSYRYLIPRSIIKHVQNVSKRKLAKPTKHQKRNETNKKQNRKFHPKTLVMICSVTY